MAKTPDPKSESNFDFDDLGGEGDPFAKSPEEGGGPSPDPFNFSEAPPAAPSTPAQGRKAAKVPPPQAKAPPSAPAAAPRSEHRAAGLSAEIPVQVVAVLGKKTITVRDLISFKKGQVVELNRFPNEAVDLVANGKLMAKGELVEIDGKLGVRIIKIFE